eukprot:COSAG05_NODE_1215_length_5490_cov_153.169542_3_plen_1192_part_00
MDTRAQPSDIDAVVAELAPNNKSFRPGGNFTGYRIAAIKEMNERPAAMNDDCSTTDTKRAVAEHDAHVSVHDIHKWLASIGRLSWKGILVKPYDSVDNAKSWLYFLVFGPFQSFSLPAMILEHLGSRLGQDSNEWRAWFGGGGLITFLGIWAVVAVNFIAPLSKLAPLLTLGAFFVVLIGVLALFVTYTAKDSEWTDIDDFTEHRFIRWKDRLGFLGVNWTNLVACVSQFTALMQLIALTVRVMPLPSDLEALTDYQQFKLHIKYLFGTILFDFNFMQADVDYFLLAVGVSYAAIVLWGLMFGGLLLHLTMNCNKDDPRGPQKRYQLYQRLRGGVGSYQIFTMLSDTFMVSILSNLLRTMDCTFDEHGLPTLDAKPKWLCWGARSPVRNSSECMMECYLEQRADVGDQPLFATASLILILYYMFSATLLAPFVVADSDGIFQPQLLDVRFSARFLLAERTAKLTLTSATIFFGTKYPWPVLLMQFNLFSFLWHYAERTKPCSILWMNSVRSAIFSASAVTSLCILLDITSHIEWAPFFACMVGLLFILLHLVRRVRHVSSRQGNVKLHKSPRMKFPEDTLFPTSSEGILPAASVDKSKFKSLRLNAARFDDSASLRGFDHRLAAVHVRVARHTESNAARIISLVCDYEMDGILMTTPLHDASTEKRTWATDGWDIPTKPEKLVLDRDCCEQITRLQLCFDNQDGVASGLAVSVRKLAPTFEDVEQVHQNDQATKTTTGPDLEILASESLVETFTRVQKFGNWESGLSRVDDLPLSLEANKAVSFYGRMASTGLIELGAIMQTKSGSELEANRAADVEARGQLELMRQGGYETGRVEGAAGQGRGASATTRAVRGEMVRAGYGFKSTDGKKDAMSGAAIERRTKWDKHFFILAEVQPPAIFWYKDESQYMADKEPKGSIPLDMAIIDIEDGDGKFAGQTILTVSTPDRNLTMRFMNRDGFESEGAEWYMDIELRCATGDVIANAVKIQARFRTNGAQADLATKKGAANAIEAHARGMLTRKELEMQKVPDRVDRIVTSMNTDDSDSVDISELASFFETMALLDGGKKKPPKVQSEELIAHLADDEMATSCKSGDLKDFLTKQFTKNLEALEKIESALLLIPVGTAVVIEPVGQNAHNSMWTEFKGKTGTLVRYYNESTWCYVQLDGADKEDYAAFAENQKPFKTEVVQSAAS